MNGARVLSVGEVLLDLATAPAGTPLSSATTLTMHLGGSPANVAVGLARLGVDVGLLTSVGADALGEWIKRELRVQGVATDGVVSIAGKRTGLLFLSIDEKGNREFLHAREDTADGALGPEHAHEGSLDGVGLLHHSSGPLRFPHGLELVRTLRARARERGIPVTVDGNLRPGLWPSVEENARVVWAESKDCDLFKCNEDEALTITGAGNPVDALHRMRAHCRRAAVVTLGAKGAILVGEGRVIEVPAPDARVVDSTGAGDAFMAGMLGVLMREQSFSDDTLRRAAMLGARMGTQVCTMVGACTALPTRQEGPRWLREALGDLRIE